jgi:hypothetical protein
MFDFLAVFTLHESRSGLLLILSAFCSASFSSIGFRFVFPVFLDSIRLKNWHRDSSRNFIPRGPGPPVVTAVRNRRGGPRLE